MFVRSGASRTFRALKNKNTARLNLMSAYTPGRSLFGHRCFEADALRRLLLFPRGNKYYNESDFVSAYLDFPEAPFTPYRLYPETRFELVAVNQEQESNSIRRGLGSLSLRTLTLPCLEDTHVFTSQEKDWGFAQFLPLRDTQNPKAGFVVNDTLSITVNITAKRRYMYPDRIMGRQSGFIGLKDREDDVHLNSLLQYLYHLHHFRRVRIRLFDVMDANKEMMNDSGGLSHADVGDR